MTEAQISGRCATWRLLDEPPRIGGQAEILRAVGADGSAAALKVPKRKSDRAVWLDEERETLERVAARHPDAADWIVTVLDSGVLPDGRKFIAFPWFPHSMASWLAERQPRLDQVLDVCVRATESVARLHRSGSDLTRFVVHRDLKPDNFLVDDTVSPPRVVLADLGGVKEAEFNRVTQHTGLHSPGYAPPEQMLTALGEIDESVDVHALGVMIYECICGIDRRPASKIAGPMYTAAGQRLHALDLVRSNLSPREVAEREQLRRLPLRELIRLDDMEALTREDVARFRAEILGKVAGRSANAEALAERIVGVLLPILVRALDPDPERRLRRAGQLLKALQDARDALGSVDSAAGAGQTLVASGTWTPDPTGEETDSIPRPVVTTAGDWRPAQGRGGFLVAVAGVVLAAAVALAVVGVTWVGTSISPDAPTSAVASEVRPVAVPPPSAPPADAPVTSNVPAAPPDVQGEPARPPRADRPRVSPASKDVEAAKPAAVPPPQPVSSPPVAPRPSLHAKVKVSYPRFFEEVVVDGRSAQIRDELLLTGDSHRILVKDDVPCTLYVTLAWADDTHVALTSDDGEGGRQLATFDVTSGEAAVLTGCMARFRTRRGVPGEK
jgi:serine/threonine protein kinase